MSAYRLIVLLALFVSVGSVDPIYRKVGGSVTLNPGQRSDSITSVAWKHQTDLALEWFGEEITCYRDFNGRCDLDKTSGSFIIKNLTLQHSGSYTPEINHKVLDPQQLRVLIPVPKPTVLKQCNGEMTLCNLTCEADITSDCGPVTYKWQTGDKMSNNKELSITAENQQRSFSCTLENPVSSESSEELETPFSQGNNDGVIAGTLVVLFVLIAVIVGVVCFLHKKGIFIMKCIGTHNQNPGGDLERNNQNQAERGILLQQGPGTNAEMNNSQPDERANGKATPLLDEASRENDADQNPGVEPKTEDQPEPAKDSAAAADESEDQHGAENSSVTETAD